MTINRVWSAIGELTPAELIALAERCEAFNAWDTPEQTRLNDAIHAVVPEPKVVQPPSYLRSLDAALMLVPEGSSWNMRWWSGDKRCCVTFYPPGDAPDDYFYIWEAATPALAIAAASLRARAGEME